jgi:TolA-binding protein
MARRISKQRMKHDEFIEVAFDAGAWIEKHWRTVAACVGAALALVLIVAGWSWWSGRRDTEVARLVSEGLYLYSGQQDASAGAGQSVSAGRYAEALPLFEKAARLGKRSPRGRVAEFYRGASLLRLGRAVEAIPVLEDVAGSASDRPLADAARGLVAEAYAKAGDVEKAAAAYRKLSETAGAAFPPDVALLQLARVYEDRGRARDARQVLQEIISKYPQGSAAAEARTRLESVRAAP